MAAPGVKVVTGHVHALSLGPIPNDYFIGKDCWALPHLGDFFLGFRLLAGIIVFAYEEVADHAEQGNSHAERRRLHQAPFESFDAAAAKKGGETPREAIALKCRRTQERRPVGRQAIA
jgi:hypothetical protein